MTARGVCGSNNRGKIFSVATIVFYKPPTHPSKRDQRPLLRKLHHQLLLIHRTRVTRRMLSGNQQRRYDVLAFLIPSQQ